MKFIQSIILIAALILTSCGKKGGGQENQREETSTATRIENPTLKIVFVPSTKLDETRLSGRFEENTLYWTNPINNAQEGPRGVNTPAGPALEVQGLQLRTPDKKGTLVSCYRVYKVPSDVRFAKLEIVANQTYNSWVDRQPTKYMSNIEITFIKDGQEVVGKRIVIPRNQPHNTYKEECEVPLEAQQMHMKILADNAITFQILDMKASFR